MATATTVKPHVAANIDYRKLHRELLERHAQGESIDSDQLQRLCFELGIKKTQWNQQAKIIDARFEAVQLVESSKGDIAELAALEAEHEQTAEACNEGIKRRRAELQAESDLLETTGRQPLRAFEMEHGERMESLRKVRDKLSRIPNFMRKSCDPDLHHAIGQLNQQLLALDNEMGGVSEALTSKPYQEVDRNGDVPRLIGTYYKGRDYWQDRLSMANATLADDDGGNLDMRRKAEATAREAAAKIDAIDAAKKRQAEIFAERAAIEAEIEQITKVKMMDWRAFAVA